MDGTDDTEVTDDETVELKVGDVVTLRSGGPEMTVFHIPPSTADNSPVDCCYFDNDGVYQRITVMSMALSPVEDI
jgi:uncharacterized protein YodC (DUF2158 family)